MSELELITIHFTKPAFLLFSVSSIVMVGAGYYLVDKLYRSHKDTETLIDEMYADIKTRPFIFENFQEPDNTPKSKLDVVNKKYCGIISCLENMVRDLKRKLEQNGYAKLERTYHALLELTGKDSVVMNSLKTEKNNLTARLAEITENRDRWKTYSEAQVKLSSSLLSEIEDLKTKIKGSYSRELRLSGEKLPPCPPNHRIIEAKRKKIEDAKNTEMKLLDAPSTNTTQYTSSYNPIGDYSDEIAISDRRDEELARQERKREREAEREFKKERRDDYRKAKQKRNEGKPRHKWI